MLDNEIKINQFLMQYFRMMIGDITDEQFTKQPVPGINHPAWILGHLAFVGDFAGGLLGGESKLQAQWSTLFGRGSKPSATRSDYPSKDELVQSLEQAYEQLRKSAATATPEQLSKPTTNPRAKDALPTVKEFVAFLLTGHMGIHLGQLSMWRRMIGLAPMF